MCEKSDDASMIDIIDTSNTTLLTIICATYIFAIPIRVVQHYITIVVVWRISSHTTVIKMPSEELFTASLHRAG